MRWLTGGDLTEGVWDAFFDFYEDTGSRKWGRPYLNRKFFSLLSAAMADRIVLMFAYDGATPIAGTLNLLGSDILYGRYWGATRHVPFLHFELCYYQAIDYRDRAQACRWSRPAPRASTSWRAATCRRPPTRCTGSAIPACAMRSRGSCDEEQAGRRRASRRRSTS